MYSHPGRLRTKWILESAQDLRAIHNVEDEERLTELMAEAIKAEVDKCIIIPSKSVETR